MKRSTVFLCVLIAVLADVAVSDVIKGAPLKYAKEGMTNGIKNVADKVNPAKLLFVNKCVEDLGCFYNGPPFYHPINRHISLPPTGSPKVMFHLFTPSNKDKPYMLELTPESVRNSTFRPRLNTKFVIHGFMSDIQDGDDRYKIKDAFLEMGSFNVILVDWTAHNGFPYEQAVANTRVIGAVVAKLVHLLMNVTHIIPKNVHIIGHSLGAHTAGYAGERIPNLGRITGLDPAGPGFQDSELKVRLDATDADFVDIIHTNGGENILGGLGMNDPIGHMDFYPNGGHRQLGCVGTSKQDNVAGSAINITNMWIQNGCDHSRVNEYFLESIDDRNCRFMAVQCSNYSNYEEGKCPPGSSRLAEMGYHVKKTTLDPPAKFYLRTNGEKPYCHEKSYRLE